jgi:hypothetical protein
MLRAFAHQDLRMALAATSALVAAALAKEAFLPFAAAALISLWPMLRRGASVRSWFAAGLLTLLFTADAAMLFRQLVRYGDQYAQVRTPATAASWAGFMLANALVFQALGVALLATLIAIHRNVNFRRPVFLVIIGLASQIAFYAGADHVGRYLLPGTAAFMACWIVALGRSSGVSRVVRVAAACTLSLSLALGAIASYRTAQANSESTQQFQAWLGGLEAQLRGSEAPTTVIVEPADPYLDYERILSLAEYLRSDMSVVVMTTTATGSAGDQRSQRIAAAIARMSTQGTADGLIEPLSRRSRCLSVLLGEVRPLCSSTVSLP